VNRTSAKAQAEKNEKIATKPGGNRKKPRTAYRKDNPMLEKRACARKKNFQSGQEKRHHHEGKKCVTWKKEKGNEIKKRGVEKSEA